jgi:hypothetical protein
MPQNRRQIADGRRQQKDYRLRSDARRDQIVPPPVLLPILLRISAFVRVLPVIPVVKPAAEAENVCFPFWTVQPVIS